MRIRTIKPEFWGSESIGRLSRDARLLFIALISFADDSGRGRGVFPALSGQLFPYDPDAREKLPDWFAELEREEMVRRYKGPDGNTYYDIPNWLKHQKIEKPSPSKLPAFTESSPIIPRSLPERSGEDQGSGIRDQGAREQGSGTTKAPSPEAPDAVVARERNLLFDALAEMEGGAENLTKPTAKKVGVALAHIKKASPDVSPDEIRARARNLSLHMPHATATATSLSSHWARCATPPVNGGGNHGTPPENPRNEFIGTPESRAAWERSFTARQDDLRKRQEAGEIPFA